MIAADRLSVRLGARTVLDGVSFEARAGELVCVLGPNGAGKTTLLRALAGLVPSSGAIRIAGRELARLAPSERARTIAYLPQGGEAHWPISAFDAVAIGRLPHGASLGGLAQADRLAIERSLTAVDAAHLAGRPVTELSGGERARVLLARALAIEAPILLADEPIAALDPAHQLGVLALLAGIAARGGTVLAALHDLTLSSRFAHRVLVLDAGRVAADGAPAAALGEELLARVFAIEARRFDAPGGAVVVPWLTDDKARR